MKIRLAFKRMFLEPGKTFALPTRAGARVRVVDGMVWTTTTNSPDDVWLGAGEEHAIQRSGLTVVESVTHSTVELIPPPATGIRGHFVKRYDITVPRTACNIAAIAMTVITIGVLVILPAKLAPDSREARPRLASSVVATPPTAIVASQPRGIVQPPEQTITQASSSAKSPTRFQSVRPRLTTTM
jgi:hypothetical protein